MRTSFEIEHILYVLRVSLYKLNQNHYYTLFFSKFFMIRDKLHEYRYIDADRNELHLESLSSLRHGSASSSIRKYMPAYFS